MQIFSSFGRVLLPFPLVSAALVMPPAVVSGTTRMNTTVPITTHPRTSCESPAVAPRLPITLPTTHISDQGINDDVFGVSACIDGEGPYLFELDTGSTISVIIPQLANSLRLPAGEKVTVTGSKAPIDTAHISRMSLGGVTLAPDNFLRATTSFVGFDGIIGGDVLSRFGAVEFDLQDNRVTLANSEGLQFNATTPYSLYGISVTPTWLSHRLPMFATNGWDGAIMYHVDQGVVPVVNVEFGKRESARMVLDSGASISSISTSSARSAALTWTGRYAEIGLFGGAEKVKLEEAASWRIGDAALPDTYLFVGPGTDSFAGSIGENVVDHFSYFVIDYRDAEVLFH
jgi:hypothetical protein